MGKYDWIDTPVIYAYFDGEEPAIPRDPHRRAQACQVLLELVGLETGGQHGSLWTGQGPTRRASWMKGYIRRAAPAGAKRSVSPIASLSHSERTMLLVAFDLWNGTGEVLFRDVLNLTPRLTSAIAGFVEAGWADPTTADAAIERWISRWSVAPPGGD